MIHELRLLGTPRLEGASGPFGLERKTAAVLAYLALEGATPKYKLAGWLWPASGETTARNNMRQLLRRLRLAAGEPLVIEPGGGDGRIALRPDLRTDVDDGRAPLPAGTSAEALAGGEELLAHLDFDDAPDFAEWLDAARELLRRRRLDAADRAAERLEAEGRVKEALAYAALRVRLEPESEAAYRKLARLQHLLGDRGAALATLQRCRGALHALLNSAPLPETLALERDLRLLGGCSRPDPAGRGRSAAGAGGARPLTPAALDLARVVAVAGRGFTLELASAVLERTPDELAAVLGELNDARLLRGVQPLPGWRLEALRAATPPPLRRLLHARTARWLAAAGAGAARVGRHERAAAEPEAGAAAAPLPMTGTAARPPPAAPPHFRRRAHLARARRLGGRRTP